MPCRSTPGLVIPTFAVCALVLTACGEQAPGGLQPGEQHPTTATSPPGPTSDEPTSEPAADDPIVVSIGEDEFATIMVIYDKYVEAKGGPLELQAPTAPVEELAGGMMQEYRAGAIYWRPDADAYIVRGEILAAYLGEGGPDGRLGWPVGDETVEDEVISSDFEHGQIRVEDRAIHVDENTAEPAG